MTQQEEWEHADDEVRKNLPLGVKLVRTLRGHTAWIGRIAWSPGGNMLASPSADKTIRLWDAETGELRAAIEQAIEWENLLEVSSSQLFADIKAFLLEVKQTWRLLAPASQLYDEFARQHPDTAAQVANLRDQFDTCIERLENRDLIRRLTFGGYVLLQPELLDAYASAMVNTAKEEPDGLGSMAEEIALAVRLGHSGLFTTGRAVRWRNAAVFSAKAGGKCGLFLHEFAEARGRLILFFDEKASAEMRFHFEEYVLAHTERRALDGTVELVRFFICAFDAFVMSAKGETSTSSFHEWARGARVTLAIVFTDVVGSTALGEEIRDEATNEVRRAHFAQSRRLIA